jgi:hypothetical protein
VPATDNPFLALKLIFDVAIVVPFPPIGSDIGFQNIFIPITRSS